MGLRVEIFYNNKDVTKELSSYFESLTYTCNVNMGELAQYDDVSLTLDNSKDNFINEDYPEKGAKLSFKLTDLENPTIVKQISGFFIDQVTSNKGKQTGSRVVINASTYNRKNYATSKKVDQYYKNTFKSVMQKIAENANLNLTLDDNFSDFKLPSNIVQWEVTDFRMLQFLGRKYGFTYGIREGNLFVLSLDGLESKKISDTIDVKNLDKKNFLIDSTFTDDISFGHKYIKVKIQDYNGKLASVRINEEIPTSPNDTTIIVSTPIQDRATQLEINALSSEDLRFIVRGNLTMKGRLQCAVAGNTVNIVNNGEYNGKYMLKNCVNKINKKGAFIQNIQMYKTINQIGI